MNFCGIFRPSATPSDSFTSLGLNPKPGHSKLKSRKSGKERRLLLVRSFGTCIPSIHPCPKTLRCSLGAHTLLILRQPFNSLKSICCPTHVLCSNYLRAAALPGFHICCDKTSVSDRKPDVRHSSWRLRTASAASTHTDRQDESNLGDEVKLSYSRLCADF